MLSFNKIFEKYQKDFNKLNAINKTNIHPDVLLFQDWAFKVKRGWYGFSIGRDAPLMWVSIINDFLVELEKEAPDFSILQIKTKFGGLRFYVDLGNTPQQKAKAIIEEISLLEQKLFLKELVY